MPDNTAGSVAFDMAIDQLRDMGYEFDAFVSLLPTAPLRLPWDLDNAIKLYWKEAYPSRTQLIAGNKLTSAVHIPGRIKSDLWFKPWYTRASETMVLDNGLLSICDVKSYRAVLQRVHEDRKHLLQTRRKVRRVHPYSVFYLTKAWQQTDIDYLDEFEFAEMLFQHFILDKGYYQ